MAVEMASRTNNENAASSLTTTGKSPRKSKSDHIEILITSGPHSDSKVLLRPKPNAPCFIGRSKGKKFINNGISLSKDQEVSTTHAKIVVEMSAGSLSDAAFYFVDVGSTNGSTLKGEMLEPEVKVKIVQGMEIKVGGSTLKFILGWVIFVWRGDESVGLYPFCVEVFMAAILEIQSINQTIFSITLF